jgi:hypothetical protein
VTQPNEGTGTTSTSNQSLAKEADLSITLDIPQGVGSDSPYSAQLGVLNIGNAPSGPATVNVTLPNGVQLDPVGSSELASSGCQVIDPQTIVCQIEAIASGEGRRVRLQLINTGTLRSGADALIVKVQGVSFERNLENNVARVSVLSLSASPSLALTGVNTSTLARFGLLLLAFGYMVVLMTKPRTSN